MTNPTVPVPNPPPPEGFCLWDPQVAGWDIDCPACQMGAAWRSADGTIPDWAAVPRHDHQWPPYGGPRQLEAGDQAVCDDDPAAMVTGEFPA